MLLETIKCTTPEDTESLQRFLSIKYWTEFKESTISMATIVICDEFEEIFCYMSTEMRSIFCCVVNNCWFFIRESGKSLFQSKWIGVCIKITSVCKKSCNTASYRIMRLNSNSGKRPRECLPLNSLITNMPRDFFHDIFWDTDITCISPGRNYNCIDSFF